MKKRAAKRKAPPPKAAGLLSFDEIPEAFLFAGKMRVSTVDEALRRVSAVEKRSGARVHIVDADAVCGPAHLASALLHARRSHAQGRARARDPKVELMLYLSGHRQIERAIQVAGLSPRTRAVAFVIEGERGPAQRAATELTASLELAPDLSVLTPGLPKLARLGVLPGSPKDTDLEALALENVAILDLE
jgi:KEOPS complex subunit Cgi121